MENIILQISSLLKNFNTVEGTVSVLQGINLVLHEGQSIAVTGESGCGKSTLLHIIAGLEPPSSGTVRLHGVEIWKTTESNRAQFRRNNIGIIFQQFNLIPTLTILQNIYFHSKLVGRYDKSFCNSLVSELGLQNILNRYPDEVSGGQQQRAAIARAIAAKPKLLLADEPTGNLDEENTQTVIDIIKRLIQNTNTAFLVATHSTTIANAFDNRVELKSGNLDN